MHVKNVYHKNKIILKYFYDKYILYLKKHFNMVNKNALCKIILTNWKTINKTILYGGVWSVFDQNFNTVV